MAIEIIAGFKVGSKEPIDSRMVLSTSAMKEVNPKQMPDNYFAINSDDGRMYIYNSDNPDDEQTGKFKKMVNYNSEEQKLEIEF